MNDNSDVLTHPVSDPVVIYVNSGHASYDNGAQFPLTFFHDLAAAAGCEIEYGVHYYDDRLLVRPEDVAVVESLLIEHGMLYRLVGRDTSWVNIRPGSNFEKYLIRTGAVPVGE